MFRKLLLLACFILPGYVGRSDARDWPCLPSVEVRDTLAALPDMRDFSRPYEERASARHPPSPGALPPRYFCSHPYQDAFRRMFYDNPALAEAYIKENRFTFPVLLNARNLWEQLSMPLGIPQSWLIDRGGRRSQDPVINP